MINDIEKQKIRDKLIAASKKVSKNSLIENLDLEASLDDGLFDENSPINQKLI